MAEPTDLIHMTLAPEEWRVVCIELLQQSTFDTARPFLQKILSDTLVGSVSMSIGDWNEIIVIMRNGRYAMVAPVILKLVNQGNAATGRGNGEPEEMEEGISVPKPPPITRSNRKSSHA